jgi:Zn-dependent peptidase ImmA (M78 family)
MNGKRDVWSAVEEFRAQYSIELGTLPVDVLTVIELRLKLDVIPFPDLFQKYSVDAAVLPDFSGIYVDERSYRFLEGKPIWLFNRLRFSLAHELGHIILHRDLVKDLKFTSLQVFRDWTQRCQQSRFSLEWEANEFGGRLLVPIDRLKKDFDTFVTRIQDQFPAWWTNSDLRSALADQLGEDYGVHKDMVSCRLDREDLWPSP